MVGMRNLRAPWVNQVGPRLWAICLAVALVGLVLSTVTAQDIMSPARAAFQGQTILADMIVLLVSSTVLSKIMYRVFAIYRFSTNFGDRIEVHARLSVSWRSS